jgi:hypothetical protein
LAYGAGEAATSLDCPFRVVRADQDSLNYVAGETPLSQQRFGSCFECVSVPAQDVLGAGKLIAENLSDPLLQDRIQLASWLKT